MDPRPETQPSPAELVAVLEQIRGGNEGLSAAVLQAIGWHWEPFGCPGNGLWRTPNAGLHDGPLPPVTEVAEVARGLVSELFFVATSLSAAGRWTVMLFTHPLLTEADYRDPLVSAHGQTLALALCSAAVKANIR